MSEPAVCEPLTSEEAMPEVEEQPDSQETLIMPLENEEQSQKKQTRARTNRTKDTEKGDGLDQNTDGSLVGVLEQVMPEVEAQLESQETLIMPLETEEQSQKKQTRVRRNSTKYMEKGDGLVQNTDGSLVGVLEQVMPEVEAQLESQETLIMPLETEEPSQKKRTRVRRNKTKDAEDNSVLVQKTTGGVLERVVVAACRAEGRALARAGRAEGRAAAAAGRAEGKAAARAGRIEGRAAAAIGKAEARAALAAAKAQARALLAANKASAKLIVEKAKALKLSPAKTSPAKLSPAKTSPAKLSPAKTSPAKLSPAKTSPAKLSPAKTSPAPAKLSPAKEQAPETSPQLQQRRSRRCKVSCTGSRQAACGRRRRRRHSSVSDSSHSDSCSTCSEDSSSDESHSDSCSTCSDYDTESDESDTSCSCSDCYNEDDWTPGNNPLKEKSKLWSPE